VSDIPVPSPNRHLEVPGKDLTPPKRSERRADISSAASLSYSLASVQPRLDRLKRRGFIALLDPFGGFQPCARGFNEGLLMRSVVRRRPVKALQRELAAYTNMLHRTGPHLVFIGRGSKSEGSTIWAARRITRSGERCLRRAQKKTPPQRGFPSSVLLLGGLRTESICARPALLSSRKG
jgi:hypothetical protein